VPGSDTRATTASYPAVILDRNFGILDVAVTSAPGASEDTYGVGDEIRLTVTFSQPATVIGDVVFRFRMGAAGSESDRDAAYSRGSGTKELEFAYTVVAADMDDDGISVAEGTGSNTLLYYETLDRVINSRREFARRTHDALAADSGHKVDGSRSPTGPPTAPVGLGGESVLATGGYRVDLSWTEPSSSGGSAISGYKVERSADGGSNWSDAEDDTESAATSFSDTGLEAETTYTYRVSAINTQGTGPASETAEVTTGPDVPGVPTGLRATAQDENPDDLFTEIKLSWTAPENTGGSKISGYQIVWAEDPNPTLWWILEHDTGSAVTTYTDKNLPSETTRHYRVSAINDQGFGLPSDSAGATTADILGPVPEEVEVRQSGVLLSVIFYESIEQPDNAARKTSGLFAVTADGAPVTIGRADEGFTPHPEDKRFVWLDGLSPAIREGQEVVVTYWHPDDHPDPPENPRSVKDLSPRQNEAPSFVTGVDGVVAVVNNSEVEPVIPDAVKSLAVEPGADGRSLVLTWDAPPYSGGARITSYRIEVSEDGGTSFAELVAAHDETEDGAIVLGYEHEDLQPGSVRHYRVAARNRVGLADWSEAVRGELDRVGRVSVAFDQAAFSESEPLFVEVTAILDEGLVPNDGLPMEIRVTTADGTAEAPDDYTAVDVTVPLAAADFGQPVPGFYVATKRVPVPIVDDVMVEGRETLSVAGAFASGGRGWAHVTEGVVSETSIHDDDAWAVEVEAAPASLAEGETRTVTLTARIVHVDAKDEPSAPEKGACVVPFPVTVGLDVGGG
ncbi:MAG: fibronectin type III domain-containing protein, partial [Rhodospirillales bacterium]|nr:fibronectin type III domain-containing protein [Rhodospirillales bacterium]